MSAEDRDGLARLRALARWRDPPPRVRAALLFVAVVVFIGGAGLAFRELEVELSELLWWPLVVVAVLGTPATIAINAAELRVLARLTSDTTPLSWRHAARVVVVATAANILPLPGGALVRVHALRTAGAPLAQATWVTLLAALLWVVTAVGVAAVAALAYVPVAAGLALVLVLAGVVTVAALVRMATTRWSLPVLARLTAVELVTTLLHGARLWLVLLSLGVTASVGQALVLGAGAPLAAAAGVFPSGLGLSEVLSALLAPVVALPAAAGFAAAALARLVGLVATVPFALVLGIDELRATAARAAAAGAAQPDEPPASSNDAIWPRDTGSPEQ